MNYKAIIQNLLMIAIPYIKELIESKVVPYLIRRSYEIFDSKSNRMIEKLTTLVTKIEATADETKRKRHLEGFKLGVETIEVIGKKLLEASEVLRMEIDG